MAAPARLCPLCGFKAEPLDAFCSLCGAAIRAGESAGPLLPPPPKPAVVKGVLVLPDGSTLDLPHAPAALGRGELGRFALQGKASQLSRTHITVYTANGRFYVEDGKTAVQARASTNGTWVHKGSPQGEKKITSAGPVELEGGESILLARVVTLRFEVQRS